MAVERALVVAVDLRDPKRPLEPELAEFEALIEAAGAQVAGRIVQRLDAVDAATLARVRAPEFLEALGRHSWPGNIRELRNYLERCVALRDFSPPRSSARC